MSDREKEKDLTPEELASLPFVPYNRDPKGLDHVLTSPPIKFKGLIPVRDPTFQIIQRLVKKLTENRASPDGVGRCQLFGTYYRLSRDGRFILRERKKGDENKDPFQNAKKSWSVTTGSL